MPISAIEWRGDADIAMGVSERGFFVERDGERIPGILWMPEAATEPVPLVLIGHGGQSMKRNPLDLALGRWLPRRNGVAVAAIDAIDHGERGDVRDPGEGVGHPTYVALWRRADTFDRMVADWQATLDALSALDAIDQDRVGYWGLSMGTMLGLPFVAADPRIKAAVLGACGFSGPSARRGGIGDRHRRDAANVACPVLYMVQLDDEIFDRDGAIEMFDALGSKEKRLHAHPGKHSAVPLDAVHIAREWLARELRRVDA